MKKIMVYDIAEGGSGAKGRDYDDLWAQRRVVRAMEDLRQELSQMEPLCLQNRQLRQYLEAYATAQLGRLRVLREAYGPDEPHLLNRLHG